jgi:PAS domain-containing protein
MRQNPVSVPSIGVPPLARALMDAIPAGMVLFDSHGKLLYANEPARGTLGQVGETELRSQLAALGASARPLRLGPDDLGEAVFLPSDGATLAERERRAIVETLKLTRWRLAEAARRLGISRTTLWRRLKEYGISRDAVRGA